MLGVSLPSFAVGILLILVFSVNLGWLPAFGRGEVVQIGWWSTGLLTGSGRRALILPGITLSLFQITLVMRLVRAEMMETLRTDFIRFARARGLSEPAIQFRHALRNCLMPVITVTGLQIGNLIAFALVTETVFQWPGMGHAVRPGGHLRRYPRDGGLPDHRVVHLRQPQHAGRPDLCVGRSAPARRKWLLSANAG